MRRRDFLPRLLGLVALPALAAAREAPAEFPPVQPGRPLRFPDDHGAHPAFRTEWWYATGWLEGENAGTIGFQGTFFRVRTGMGETSSSAFAPRQLILAHAAIGDPRRARLLHDERAARVGFGRAGFGGAGDSESARVWVGDWRFSSDAAGYAVAVASDDFAYALHLTRRAPPLLNGAAGFSRKGPDPRHASYYYSEAQLAVAGEVTLGGRRETVRGKAWLDHEWSSELLPPTARGWDWVGVNLHDGGALMAFRLRTADDAALWAAATLRDAAGRVVVHPPQRVAFTPRRRWQSPRTRISYPVEWTIAVGRRVFVARPLFDDQELDSRRSTGAIYWEGAIRLFEDEREVGRGYLEMTGYGERLRIG